MSDDQLRVETARELRKVLREGKELEMQFEGAKTLEEFKSARNGYVRFLQNIQNGLGYLYDMR